jgi:hypothetical protein
MIPFPAGGFATDLEALGRHDEARALRKRFTLDDRG